MRNIRILVVASLAIVVSALSQEAPPVPSPRVSVSAGLSVAYVRAKDLTDMANTTQGAAESLPSFKTAVEFFAAISIPVSDRWAIKCDYTYFLASYNVSTSGTMGLAENSVTGHFPSILAQYVILNAGVYNLKVAAGGGYHFGSVAKRFFTEDDTYSGTGVGVIGDLEANTAFGEHIYVYIGGIVRWEGIGPLSDARGRNAGVAADGSATTMHMFGAAARLGFSYLF